MRPLRTLAIKTFSKFSPANNVRVQNAGSNVYYFANILEGGTDRSCSVPGSEYRQNSCMIINFHVVRDFQCKSVYRVLPRRKECKP